MLGVARHVDMSVAEAEAYFKERVRRRGIFGESLRILRDEVSMRRRVRGTREVDALVRAAKRVLPGSMRQAVKRRLTGGRSAAAPAPPASRNGAELPIHPLPPGAIRMQAAKSAVRIDKSKRLLGYDPRFDFAAGMRRTAEWARWANLLESTGS
jgi:hypothetical protein